MNIIWLADAIQRIQFLPVAFYVGPTLAANVRHMDVPTFGQCRNAIWEQRYYKLKFISRNTTVLYNFKAISWSLVFLYSLGARVVLKFKCQSGIFANLTAVPRSGGGWGRNDVLHSAQRVKNPLNTEVNSQNCFIPRDLLYNLVNSISLYI